jgi:hypothetical protein
MFLFSEEDRNSSLGRGKGTLALPTLLKMELNDKG